MNSINNFIGNKEAISKLLTWLTDWFHNGRKETNYVILQGVSGNGKTELVVLLAQSFEVELLRILPSDIKSIKDLNGFVKSLNVTNLEGKKHKLILIDDFDDYQKEYLPTLYELPSISKHPIIYACKTTYFDKDFMKGAMYAPYHIRLKKPLTSELLEYLKTISELSEDKLKEIAQESKSTRSAIIAVKTATVNGLLNPAITRREFLISINQRKLEEPINRDNIHFVFDSIRGYDKDALKVMMRFAEFNYRIKAKYEEIDSFFVNEMLEPIENVKLEYNYVEENNNKKKPEKERVEKKAIIKQPKNNKSKKPMSTLDNFM